MRAQQAVVARQGEFAAMIEQNIELGGAGIWHYVISSEASGEEVYDGWAGDLEEAKQSAELHLVYLNSQVQG